MAAKVITVAIEKGGTGKTVTASNLAYLMGDEGKRVLCIDTDPQGNLTKALSGGKTITSEELYGRSLYDMFDAYKWRQTKDFIWETEYENVDMIPCDYQTTRISARMETLMEDANALPEDNPRKVKAKGEFLDYFISQVRDDYDFIVIDTQPTRDSLLLSNALFAADFVLIPASCDDNSEESAFRLYSECINMQKSPNSHLQGAGVLLANFDKSAATEKKIQGHYEEVLGASLFGVAIPNSKTVKTSISLYQPVCYMAKTQPVAKAYVKVYEELKKRLGVN